MRRFALHTSHRRHSLTAPTTNRHIPPTRRRNSSLDTNSSNDEAATDVAKTSGAPPTPKSCSEQQQGESALMETTNANFLKVSLFMAVVVALTVLLSGFLRDFFGG